MDRAVLIDSTPFCCCCCIEGSKTPIGDGGGAFKLTGETGGKDRPPMPIPIFIGEAGKGESDRGVENCNFSLMRRAESGVLGSWRPGLGEV